MVPHDVVSVTYPGGDTLGIVTKVPTGQKDSLNQPITTDSVEWIYGCVLETLEYEINEHQTDTIAAFEKAWAFLPYSSTTAAIDNGDFIRPKRPDANAQRDYKVNGRAVVQYDIDGRPDHVFVLCEWQGG